MSQLTDIDNGNSFIVKLPFTSGSILGDGRNIKRDCRGKEGISEAIISFLKHHPMVLGYITYVIVQPQFHYTTEAKASIYVSVLFTILKVCCIYKALILNKLNLAMMNDR